MRSASALRFSNGCSSLNLERMLASVLLEFERVDCGMLRDVATHAVDWMAMFSRLLSGREDERLRG